MDFNPIDKAALPTDALSDEDVAGLARTLESERNVLELTEVEQARQIFIRHAPVAATAICRIAAHSPSERMKFQAATYVLDRAMGRLQDAPPTNPQSPLDLLVAGITKELSEAELLAIQAQVQDSSPEGRS